LADQEHNNEPHSFHQEGSTVIFDKPPSEAAASRQRRENEQHEFAREQVKTNRRIAWFNGLLVLGTFVGMMIGIWQATISRKAANAARDAVKVSSDTLTETQSSNARQALLTDKVRESSEKTAAKSLQATIDNFHQEQRAWLGLCADGIEPLDSEKPLVFAFKFCNSGKTPAYKVQQRIGLKTSPVPLDGPSEAELSTLEKTSANAVPPQGDYFIHGGGDIKVFTGGSVADGVKANSRVPDIINGTLILYLFGDVFYHDSFGNKVHDTQFCMYLPNPKKTDLGYCKKHNQLD